MSPGGNWTFSFRLDPRVEPAALDHLLKDVARAGFHAIELPITSHGLMTPESPEPDCRALGERIRASDLSPATLSLDACDDLETHLAAPDEAHRRMACDRIVSVLDQTAWLGAGALVITPARVGRPVDPTPAISYESAYAYALEALLELRFKAARRAVRIACRVAANRFLPSPLETREFLDACNSPWVGAAIDSADVMACGGHPGDWIRLLTYRLVHVVVSDCTFDSGGVARRCALGTGEGPWTDVAAAMGDIDFHGTITCGDPEVDPAESIARLHRAFGE